MRDNVDMGEASARIHLRSKSDITVELEVFTPSLVRLRIGLPTETASYLAGRQRPSKARVSAGQPRSIATGGLNLRASEDIIEFCSFEGEPRLRLSLSALGLEPELRVPLQTIGEQHFYGLGGGSPLDRLGMTRRLWNAHVNHGQGADVAIPLLLSSVGYGLFFDSSCLAVIDAGASADDTFINYTSKAKGVDLYYLRAGNLRDLMSEVAGLLGRAPLPPRWGLGYLQSTRHFKDEKELRELPRTFRRKRIPCDGLIFLSTYSDCRGWNRGVGHLDYQPDLFSDPRRFFAQLKSERFHVMTHEYPVLHPQSPAYVQALDEGHLLDSGYPYVFPEVRTSSNYHEGQRHLDFSSPATRDWWWRQHRDLLNEGVDGWWLDGGEGPSEETRLAKGMGSDLHNRFDLLRQQAFFEGEMRDRPNHRPFLLCRSGGPGMQRFGAACWSGDVNGSFATLEEQIATGLNAGMSGVPYWGSDIGGYYPTLPDSAELFVRWFQFGAFSPIFRAHGQNWRKHTPWGHGAKVEAICKAYLELRYRLMPYTYTLARQAQQLGLPLMRPLVLNYPDDPRTWDLDGEFLWGDDLLVAPVTREGARYWPVYLPKGCWHDFWTNRVYEGPCAVTVPAPLDRLPLFVRAGALLPTCPVVQFDGERERSEITLLVYPEGRSSFTLYEDDGSSNAYRNGAYALTRFDCTANAHSVVCRISAPEGDDSVLPKGRYYTVKIRASKLPLSVDVEQEIIEANRGGADWSHDETGFIVVRDVHHPCKVKLAF